MTASHPNLKNNMASKFTAPVTKKAIKITTPWPINHLLSTLIVLMLKGPYASYINTQIASINDELKTI